MPEKPKDEPRAAAEPARPEAKAKGDAHHREIERLKQEAKQAHDQYLRALAEFENTKKRLQREKEEFVRYAAETVVRGLLPILDSLDQALVAVDPSTRPASAGLRKQSDIEAIMKGVHLIHRQLLGLLDKEGVKRIPTVGEPFDPHKHEAVAQVEISDDTPDDTVVEEVQIGYTMHGRVLRPAMVKVAKAKDQKSEVRSQKSDQGPENKDQRLENNG